MDLPSASCSTNITTAFSVSTLSLLTLECCLRLNSKLLASPSWNHSLVQYKLTSRVKAWQIGLSLLVTLYMCEYWFVCGQIKTKMVKNGQKRLKMTLFDPKMTWNYPFRPNMTEMTTKKIRFDQKPTKNPFTLNLSFRPQCICPLTLDTMKPNH